MVDQVCDGVAAMNGPTSGSLPPALPAPTTLSTSCGDVVLTEKEKQIFDILLDAASTRGTILRVAGGWVRDKVLRIGK